MNKITAVAVGVVAVLAAIFGVVAFTASSDDDASIEGASEFQNVVVTGEALPEFGKGETDPAIGMAAPVLEGFGFLGNEVTTTPGNPMLLVFLAHWCPFCQKEVPILVKWNQSGLVPSDLDVIAITTGTDETQPNFPPSVWLANEKWPELWPVLVDNKDQTAGNAFGLAGYPFMTLIGADGTVLWRNSGEISAEALTDAVNAALGN
ncbi:MAG: TlpA family protein disulfide reductase [Actinobacteria bacterium]|nr:TlpA family protein disulfide reductase [Actinomycetota bacterium]MBM3815933.1 TlpA family protein disulfide reductase [Actinomycetota bacterium]